jgi:hypothetical protein
MYENNTFLQNNNNDEMAKKIFGNKQQKNNALAQTKKALSLISGVFRNLFGRGVIPNNEIIL